MLTNKRILITGGTGSLGKVLVRRILAGEIGNPAEIRILSRDEGKHHQMKLDNAASTVFKDTVRFRIGDVRDIHSVSAAMKNIDVIINAAALKQVPSCEYAPYEAVMTNITGAENIVRLCRDTFHIETVVGISTDKACEPVNVMGMTKAIQERLFIQANLDCPSTRFICVRYGNVLSSRGSVVPMFQEQIAAGKDITITAPEMTRFLLSLDDAVDIVFMALREAGSGETYVPKIASATMMDIARVLIGDKPIKVKVIGIRPGEKIHESLISEEEARRTVKRGKYYVILPSLPEFMLNFPASPFAALSGRYTSRDVVMSRDELRTLFADNGIIEREMERLGV